MAANAARKKVALQLADEVAQLRGDIAWLRAQVEDLQQHAAQAEKAPEKAAPRAATKKAGPAAGQ